MEPVDTATDEGPTGMATAAPSPGPVQTIQSILEEGRETRFLAFHEEILFERLSLQDIASRIWLHQGVLEFQFEQLGDLGTADDPADGHVVLLRIDDQLFAVRAVHPGSTDDSEPLLCLPTRDGSAELQVLSCGEFLGIWSQHTGVPPEAYNIDSSIQPFMRSLITGEPLQQHGRPLVVESVLGQGLEGTVFAVRDQDSGEAFALKSTHKDVRDLYAHWTAGLDRIRQTAPHLLPHLCEFVSIEYHGEQGCTVLLQYRPLISFREFIGQLPARERLREGLRVLAGCIRLVQTLRSMEICHGDIGVSNLFLYPESEGVDQVALIDPHPDGLTEGQAMVRKDLFGLSHMLYWLVTGTEWPDGTHGLLQRVLAGEHSHSDASRIFRAPPLSDDREYEILHEAAISALAGSTDTSDEICELILIMSDRMSSSAIAAPGRVAEGATVTAAAVERIFRRILRPIGSGVFLPIFSLPSAFDDKSERQRNYGMGDTGPAAREFILRLKATGQKYWCILPVGPTDDHNCVYRSDSVFAMGLNTIPPDSLLADGWITEADLDELVPQVATEQRIPLEDPNILHYKRTLLNCVWERYCADRQWQDQFCSFQQQEADWLYDYCTYKVIEAQYPERWTTWPDELRDAESVAIRSFAAEHAEEIEREAFFQFLAQHYFLELRRFAESHGILLIGDLPAYSAHGSADVWGNRDVFELAPDGQRTLVAGAPPDMFDPQGQAWNHPMYRWDSVNTVQFHTRRFARMRRLYGRGYLRDDHFIGRITPWGFPFGTKPADGERVTGKYLGNPLFDAIFTRVPGLQQSLIGEDLGVVTQETTLLMQHYGLFGMRVLQFIPFHADEQTVEDDMYTPGNYSDHNLILLGTHDTPTIRQWWRYGLDDTGRRHVEEFIRRRTGTDVELRDDNAAEILSEFAARQSACMFLHQMPDLLQDEDGGSGLVNARMNDPALGEAEGRWQDNWSWRMTPDSFDEATMERLRAVTVEARRTPEHDVQRLPEIPEFAEELLLACAVLRARITDGQSLAVRLRQRACDGLIRSASLGTDLLSAVCGHVDGNAYLLLSDANDDQPRSTPDQAVSLIRAFDAALRHNQPFYRSPLEEITDASLLQSATEQMQLMEQRLHRLAAFSDPAEREQMVTFLGGLLSTDRNTQSGRFEHPWTQFWLDHEQRHVGRDLTVDNLLCHPRPSLQGFRWNLLTSRDDDCRRIDVICDDAVAAAIRWTADLSLRELDALLFGTSDIEQHTDADVSASPGISDTLHRLQQLRRREQPTALQDLQTRAPREVSSLIESVTSDSIERQAMLECVNTFSAHGPAVFELLLETLEEQLVARLAVTAPPGEQDSQDFPAQIDLQLHSFESDCGGQSIARIVRTARRRGLKTIALTDHQTFDGVLYAVQIGQRFGVRVIPALELYTGIDRGRGSVENRRDVLVYFPDVEQFRVWCDGGVDDESRLLFDDGWNRKLPGSQWGDVPIARVTSWARSHGGVPVLAHPGLLSAEAYHQNDWSFDAFEQLFLDTGLAGIEISHSKLPFDDNTVRYVPLVQEFNRRHPQRPLVFTVGTDSHTPEGIGRANLTADTVQYLTEHLVPDSGRTSTLEQSIVNGICEAAARITAQSELYRLQTDVLENRFPGTTPDDRPLRVVTTSDGTPHPSIIAGLKSYQDQPLIVIVNQDRREQYEGKDWGRLDLTDVMKLFDDLPPAWQLQELISGAIWKYSTTELIEHGLHVGLLPYATQFLQLVPLQE